MAAEVVARDLQRDLYRVDLAQVVSKYIGETEKNLRRIVIEAERARCVLLFDEADALFGRRTEVRDSHDRYANIEVSYLLQLIEETEAAVVLLTTNRREAIDEAFLRRFRFLIDFPLPDAEIRRKLWANSFPPQLDIRNVRFDVLADRLPLTGANVKNIALAATCLAASNGGIVGSEQIAHATRRELERMGRPAPFSDADLTDRLVPKRG
jgi:SpoVK/Ycf46/Vps4 family AAA+-type ATPase